MINALANQIKLRAQGAISTEARVRIGIIDGYDPSHFAVKVRIQPENTLTGWMPLTSPWVGNLWGMYAAPNLGDQVEVHFQQNGSNAGFVVQRFFSNVVRPLAVPSGEFWLVHASGSFIKLTNDTKVSVNTAGDLDATVGGSTNLTSAGNVTVTTPNLVVNGNIQATGDITDRTNSTNESMDSMRARYNQHVHLPGNVTPTPQM